MPWSRWRRAAPAPATPSSGNPVVKQTWRLLFVRLQPDTTFQIRLKPDTYVLLAANLRYGHLVERGQTSCEGYDLSVEALLIQLLDHAALVGRREQILRHRNVRNAWNAGAME